MSEIFATWQMEIRAHCAIFCLCRMAAYETAENSLWPLSFSDNVNLLAVKLGVKEHWLKATCLFTEPGLRSPRQSWTAQHGAISTQRCIVEW